MERNLPATTTDAPPADQPATAPLPARRPVSVAFLPLALATFVIVAFVIAAWTFLAGAM
ncbi:MAG TPA: hypothetical protein VHQ42_05510 [Candidatus Limnocylindria bacterium]|nr:hypothetical protein [Candidatus Limnocylindria bacterium]